MENNEQVTIQNTPGARNKDDSLYYNNYAELEGFVVSEPSIHHRVHDENIYSFFLRVPRLNKEVVDTLPIEVSERVLDISSIKLNDPLRIYGQFRSYNEPDYTTGKSHLKMFVFVRDIEPIQEVGQNNYSRLCGNVCKKPVFRITPTGREICDLLLAVNRIYGRSDYIPVITWSRDARYASGLEVGTPVTIEGRIQSRVYLKRVEGKEERESHTVYEVSSYKIVRDEEVPEIKEATE